MNVSETAGLEEQLKNARELVARRDMAIKLNSNREFRKLILEDWCATDAARLIGMSADPNLSKQEREDSVAMAQAPGHLRRWLSVAVVMGNTAAREIGEVEEALAEIRAEPEQGVDAADLGNIG